jgi:hypothetical protein
MYIFAHISTIKTVNEVNLSEDELDMVYQYLINQAEDLNANEVLLNQINEDFENHKMILHYLKTDLNRLVVTTFVESHGHKPDTWVKASHTGVMRADIYYEGLSWQ